MGDNLSNRGPQDRSRVNLSEDWEVNYWAKEFGCTSGELKKAVDEVGSSAAAVRTYFNQDKE